MDRAERLRKVLAERFGIRTDAELLKALEDLEPLDIGIFRVEVENGNKE